MAVRDVKQTTQSREPEEHVEQHPSRPQDVISALPTVAMPIRRLVGDTDIEVFPIALGGSVFGWTIGPDETESILDRYVAGGGNFIDTADSYASGRSEVQIGRWMRTRGNRDSLVIATKIGRHADYPGLSRDNILRAANASLERLGTDRIDVLYLHGVDPDTQLEETLGAVRELMDAGRVRALGASSFPADALVQARILAAAGYPKVTAYETEYSLANRTDFEGDGELVASGQKLAVMPFFALASGFLTGKYRTRAAFHDGTRGARAAAFLNRRGLRILRALDAVAAEHGTTPAAVALAWLLTRPAVCAPVVGATDPDQVSDLMAAPTIALSRSQVMELDRASRR
ncbi:aldo/keto reductase [Paramicrobacterium sp. CJ85]|uniref:aldo/keto reductase n=1 Tax=Paramicrobacterium sp. CJ85 TaxID=3445355 RepID=UPI003F5E447A